MPTAAVRSRIRGSLKQSLPTFCAVFALFHTSHSAVAADKTAHGTPSNSASRRAEGHLGASSLSEWTEPGYGPDYFRFANVKIVGTELLFFTDPGSHVQTQVPEQIRMNSDELVIFMNVTKVPVSEASVCKDYIHQPAILIAGTPWDHNLYEMISNNIMPLWGTAKLEKLLDPDRYLNTTEPPDPGSGPFMLIQARQEGFDSPWSYIFDYMSRDQRLLDEVNEACFSHLTVISTSILRFLVQPYFQDHHLENRYEAKRRYLLQEFKRWLYLVESLYQRRQGLPKPAKLEDSAPYTRPRVLFSSRPMRSG